MMTIWKFPLQITDEQFVEMPHGAEILTIQMQGGQPQLWVKCLSDARKVRRHIRIYGTGHQVHHAEKQRYISTFQVYGGDLVFHAFEVLL